MIFEQLKNFRMENSFMRREKGLAIKDGARLENGKMGGKRTFIHNLISDLSSCEICSKVISLHLRLNC
jgi:hypothetical protein